MDSRCGECVTFAAAGGSRPYRRRMPNPRYLLGDARWFHAYSRGTGPMVIYRNAGDFQTFSRMLAWTVRKFEWELYAYCLMPTQYHLLLQTPLERLSAGMHRLNGGYAQTFNRRHGRVGHLFGSRFHAPGHRGRRLLRASGRGRGFRSAWSTRAESVERAAVSV
jgi:REP element-mobilizing transposase RayT